MRSDSFATPTLLSAIELVYANVNGVPPRRAERGAPESPAGDAATGDRTFWTAYDYYMDESERRALRRAHRLAGIREFAHRLASPFTGTHAHHPMTDHSPA